MARISRPPVDPCPASAIPDSLFSRYDSTNSPVCCPPSLQPWDYGTLHRRGRASVRSQSWSSLLRTAHGKNSETRARVDNSGLLVADCCLRAALRLPGTQRKDDISSHRLQIQTRANSQLTTAATDVASVREEENNAGKPADASIEGKIKASGQLARWARARKVRAGKLNTNRKIESIPNVGVLENGTDSRQSDREVDGQGHEELEPRQYYAVPQLLDVREKCVYMVSDGTGWTADHSVHAALGQFEHCMVDQRCSVNTHLFSDVNDVDRLMEIIRHAGLEGGMVVYTLADPVMSDVAKQACEILQIPHIDILGPITEALATHLGVLPLGLPRGAPGRKTTLSKQYFKRIEAVEFTIKQDDGALPKNLRLADLILVGVSRTSKTPLSTYIAQKGYKVANVPLVFGIDPPKELFEIDQDKVFGLTINASFLKAIRLARYRHLGVAENSSSSYSDMEHIRTELEYSRKLFSQNPRWPVIEVTGKAIEETAAVILRLYHERRNKFSMPRISTRY